LKINLRHFLISVLFLLFTEGFSQRPYHGIVADSATLQNIPDVHISIKNSGKGVISNGMGSFIIYAKPSDTLLFTSLNYKPLQLPLLFEEDAIMILLKENVQLLPDLIIKSTRLYPNKIEDRTREAPKTLDAFGAIISPFDYFWREERDKRKLSKLVEENNRTQVYRQVISDPDVKQIMMDTYSVNEDAYHGLIVRFNQSYPTVHYFTDPDKIMESLHDFFIVWANKQ